MNVLPFDIAGALTAYEAQDEYDRILMTAITPRVPLAGARLDQACERRIERVIADYLATPAGVGQRHNAFVALAASLIGKQKGGWPGLDNVEGELWSIGRSTQRDEREIAGAIAWAHENATPEDLPQKRDKKLRTKSALYEPNPVPAETSADRTIHARYVTVPTDTPPQRQPREKPVKLSYDERPALPEPTPEALTLRQYAPYMFVCPEYALIHLATTNAGIEGGFTAVQLADLLGVSEKTAQRMINRGLEWELIGEVGTELKTIKNPDSIVFNSVQRRYRLTPKRGYDLVLRELWHRVLECMEAPEPGRVGKDEAAIAGLDDARAGQLEVTTAAIAETNDALEVSARAERWALEKAREIERLAEYDDTPFTPDTLPGSVRELRTLLIEALIATNPNTPWLHRDFALLTGVKPGSVSYLIAKSDKIAPAPNPVFRDFPIEGEDKHKAVRARCREHRGAPVAWLDAKGEVLAPFSREVPTKAAGVKLNCGKTYVRKDPTTVNTEPGDIPAPAETPMTEPEPVDEAKQAQRRAQLAILPRLRGCLEARGWRHYPGAYGYWERDNQSYANTWDGIVEALLTDYEWAASQARAGTTDALASDDDLDDLVAFAVGELGAVVRKCEPEAQS